MQRISQRLQAMAKERNAVRAPDPVLIPFDGVARNPNQGDPYEGTLSAVPVRDSHLLVATSSKRERGKVKGNKKKPNTYVSKITECKVYASQDDYDAGNVSYTVESRKTKRTAAAKVRDAMQARIAREARQEEHKERTRNTASDVALVATQTVSMEEIRRRNGL